MTPPTETFSRQTLWQGVLEAVYEAVPVAIVNVLRRCNSLQIKEAGVDAVRLCGGREILIRLFSQNDGGD